MVFFFGLVVCGDYESARPSAGLLDHNGYVNPVSGLDGYPSSFWMEMSRGRRALLNIGFSWHALMFVFVYVCEAIEELTCEYLFDDEL